MTKRTRAGLIVVGLGLFVVFVWQPRMVQVRDRQRSSCVARNGGDALSTDLCLEHEYGWPVDVAEEAAEGVMQASLATGVSAGLGRAYSDLAVATEAKSRHDREAALGPMARMGHYVRSWWWWLEGYEGL
jgi:hypothetical protein